MLSGGRPLVVNMLALPVAYRWLAFLPAIFLATLFFLDQNMCAGHSGLHGTRVVMWVTLGMHGS